MHHAAYLNPCEFAFKSSQEEASNGLTAFSGIYPEREQQPCGDTYMPFFDEASHDNESSLYLPNDFKCY